MFCYCSGVECGSVSGTTKLWSHRDQGLGVEGGDDVDMACGGRQARDIKRGGMCGIHDGANGIPDGNWRDGLN